MGILRSPLKGKEGCVSNCERPSGWSQSGEQLLFPAQVNQTWVTQLQLEMLAAPAQSALLVSRSASKVHLKNPSDGLPAQELMSQKPRSIPMLHLIVAPDGSRRATMSVTLLSVQLSRGDVLTKLLE